MPPLYSRYLTRTLSDAVHALLDMPPSDQFHLFEELALVRDAAGQSIKMYGLTREIADAAPGDLAKQAMVADAAKIMVEALQQVVKVVDTAAAIEDRER